MTMLEAIETLEKELPANCYFSIECDVTRNRFSRQTVEWMIDIQSTDIHLQETSGDLAALVGIVLDKFRKANRRPNTDVASACDSVDAAVAEINDRAAGAGAK